MGIQEVPAPPDLDERVQSLLKKAVGLPISKDQLLTHARILVAAQEVVAERERTQRLNRETASHVEGLHYGVLTFDQNVADTAIARGRIIRQRVHASASSCSNRLVTLLKLLRMHYEILPFPVTAALPLEDFERASELIRTLAKQTEPPRARHRKSRNNESRLSHSIAGHTFLWWRYCVKEKLEWSVRHQLARCWDLSQSKDPQDFRRHVVKFKPEVDYWGVPWIVRCPSWAIE